MPIQSKTNSRSCAPWLFLAPLLAAAFLYRETLLRLGKGLFEYENAHGVVILAISLFLIWQKRHELKGLPVRPNIVAGSLFTGLGCALFVAGTHASSVIMTDFSLIIAIFGLVWLLLGTDHLKGLLLPIGYITFAYPLFDYLPQGILVYLQYVTAWLAAVLLKLMGITVHQNSIYLELPNITLQVVQVCAGLNHIIALLAVSVLLAHFTLDGWLKKIVLVASALFIGLAANGLRVAVIGVMSTLYQNGALHGPSDIFYVSFVFLAGLMAIVGLSYLMGGKWLPSGNHRVSRNQPSERLDKNYTGEGCRGGINPRGSVLYMSLLMATLIPVSASAYASMYSPRPVPMESSLADVPSRVGDWTAVCVVSEDFVPADLRPDETLARCYQNQAGDTLQLYLAYFTHQRKDRKVTDFTLNSYVEGEELSVAGDGKRMTVRRAIPNRPGTKDHIYFWYSIDGQIVSSRIGAKLALLLNGVLRNRTNGSLVVIKIERKQENPGDATPDDRAIIEAFYREIYRQSKL